MSRQGRHIVFVARTLSGESLRAARAIETLDDIRMSAICEQLPEREGSEVFAALVRVSDVHNVDQLIGAAHKLSATQGSLDRIVTTTETLLEPVACANETLGLAGISSATVRRVLDKSCLRTALEMAGINTPRARILTGNDDAEHFVSEVRFPIVLKPLKGSGGLATWCIRDDTQLQVALELMQPEMENPILAEEYLRGQELCFDTITIGDEPRFYSICCYRPSILEALEDPKVQWSCIMPRDIDGELYRDFISQGMTAVRSLSVGNAMTHMEGFLLEQGGVAFMDATLRPAGARISPMLAFAYDIDPYRAWARVAIDGEFDGPWERNYSVGTVFLRGMGYGVITEVEGVETIKRTIGSLIVDGRLPRIGAFKSLTYTGDGYITVRHPSTSMVEEAIDLIRKTVRVIYSDPESPVSQNGLKEQWGERLQYFDKQLNKPAWDNDTAQTLGKH